MSRFLRVSKSKESKIASGQNYSVFGKEEERFKKVTIVTKIHRITKGISNVIGWTKCYKRKLLVCEMVTPCWMSQKTNWLALAFG